MRIQPHIFDTNQILNTARASFQAAQSAYGKAYYEFRLNKREADLFANIRLTLALLQKNTFEKLNEETDPPNPTYQDSKHGFFTADPRSTLFGIEPNLATDYLVKDNSQLRKWCENNSKVLQLPEALLNEWDTLSSELSKLVEDTSSHKIQPNNTKQTSGANLELVG